MTTAIETTVRLVNGTSRSYAWTTPVPFGRCAGKGLKWAREALRDEKVVGRSQIKEMTVTIRHTGKRWER